MENPIGKGLAEFEGRIAGLDAALAPFGELHALVFTDTRAWRDLLTYKLAPHMAGRGCLVAAVTGGTNTGKSTVFNLLVGRSVSPMVTTAAATCHPVVAANARRYAQCLDSRLVPEFDPHPLDRSGQATDSAVPAEALFVVQDDTLPDHLILMDTPDIDSIEQGNWEVADHLRAAGDVMVAIVTAEKYKDDKVVRFFRRAVESGRLVVPVMNKANPADDFSVARRQLAEFARDAGTDAEPFVVPHDFNLAENIRGPIRSLNGAYELRSFLEDLDVGPLKERVYRSTIDRFLEDAEGFADRVSDVSGMLDDTTAHFENLAATVSLAYDPAPGKEVGHLFHQFVQSKRGAVRRTLGTGSAAFVRSASTLGRVLRTAFVKRATLDTAEPDDRTEDTLRELQRETTLRIARDFASQCVESARTLTSPARGLVGERFAQLDVETATAAAVGQVMDAEPVSEAFERHARAMLETWWEDHKGRRRALEALDGILAVMPAAIAAPIAIHTGGIGAAEAVVFAGPLAAQFVTRVMEYQFGDALFDFLSPWKAEQQQRLSDALVAHVVRPGLSDLESARDAMNEEALAAMRGALALCRTA